MILLFLSHGAVASHKHEEHTHYQRSDYRPQLDPAAFLDSACRNYNECKREKETPSAGKLIREVETVKDVIRRIVVQACIQSKKETAVSDLLTELYLRIGKEKRYENEHCKSRSDVRNTVFKGCSCFWEKRVHIVGKSVVPLLKVEFSLICGHRERKSLECRNKDNCCKTAGNYGVYRKSENALSNGLHGLFACV